MNRRVRLHEDAYHDLDAISAYIGEDSPHASVRFLETAQQAFEQIAEMPGLGALRDYGNPALVGLRVLHSTQDLDAIFAPSEE